MVRACALLMLFLACSPWAVQAEPSLHWSVGFHRLTFLDPLDDRPMHAIAFYPSVKKGAARLALIKWMPRKTPA